MLLELEWGAVLFVLLRKVDNDLMVNDYLKNTLFILKAKLFIFQFL